MVSSYSGIFYTNGTTATSNTDGSYRHQGDQKKPDCKRAQTVGLHLHRVQNQVKRTYGGRSQNGGYFGNKGNAERHERNLPGTSNALLSVLSACYMGVHN